MTQQLEQSLKDYYESDTKYIQQMQTHSASTFETYLNLLAKYILALPLSKKRLIELGCGAGISTFLIAQRFPEVECIGVDISSKNIDYAQKNNSLPNLKYEVGDCTRLNKSNGFFSIVTSFDVIEHLPNTRNALEEMIRIVEPEGYIIIKGPNHMNPVMPFLDIFCLRHSYPFTPTWFHNFPWFLRCTKYFLYNYFSSSVSFTTRIPDLSDAKQVGRDMDAVYVVSPLDLIKFFKRKGLVIMNVACPRHNNIFAKVYSKCFPLFASVGLVVQKVKK